MKVADAGAAGDRVRWHGVGDVEELQRAALQRILDAAARAIAERGRFHIVLAGGETPVGVYQMLRTARTEWLQWIIYFGDERCVPPEDAVRNSRMAATALLDHVPVPAAQVHLIPAELGARRAADSYASDLKGAGDFDLVLLGLGEDGHTASLFPDHDWGTARDAPDVLPVFGAPKPPPERVSLSAARLSRAREVWFLVAGESKRQAVARWRVGGPLPAAAIRPPAGVDVLITSTLLLPPPPAPPPIVTAAARAPGGTPPRR
jgi:6-phosphogluconolactonase